jgi:hypothetical protein
MAARASPYFIDTSAQYLDEFPGTEKKKLRGALSFSIHFVRKLNDVM